MLSLVAMEALTIAEIKVLYERAQRRREQNREHNKAWREQHAEEFRERKKKYNQVYYAKKKLARETALKPEQ